MCDPMPPDAPKPRLCHIFLCPDSEGYGFNLHANNSTKRQYIGKIDKNSPAEEAGLLEDDIINEVNGVSVVHENHRQVVSRIKAVPNQTRLLVVDAKGDEWYRDHNLIVHGNQDNIIMCSNNEIFEHSNHNLEINSEKSTDKVNGELENCTEQLKIVNGDENCESETENEKVLTENCDAEKEKSILLNKDIESESEKEESNVASGSISEKSCEVETEKKAVVISAETQSTNSTCSAQQENGASHDENGTVQENGTVHENGTLQENGLESPARSFSPDEEETSHYKTNGSVRHSSGLNFNMTAAEMRAQLANRKKMDPRNDAIDLKKKYEIVQNM